MSKQAISKHQAVLTLPKVDPASIDIKSWPSRERDERSNDPWWQSLGDDGRDEYAAAMDRSEEHTSELQTLMRISYAVSCLKKKNTTKKKHMTHEQQYIR